MQRTFEPYGPDVQRIRDTGCRVAVDQYEVGASAFGNPAAVLQAEPAGRLRGRGLQRFDRREPGLNEQLQFMVDTGSMSKTAKIRNGNGGNIRSDQYVYAGTVKVRKGKR